MPENADQSRLRTLFRQVGDQTGFSRCFQGSAHGESMFTVNVIQIHVAYRNDLWNLSAVLAERSALSYPSFGYVGGSGKEKVNVSST